jgi:hypothetical protein
LWIGAGIATLIALPNAAWQIAGGLPFLELVRNDNTGNLIGTPGAFALGEIFAINIALAPLWLTGIIAPFASARLKQVRFLAIAFVVTAILVYVTHGKNYYLAGAFPTMFAVGAAACAVLPRIVVALWSLLIAAEGALALPLVLPLLPPQRLERMLDNMSFRPPPVERACLGAPLVCWFSDQFGWPDLARSVESVYAALPSADRAKAAIFASNYGEAAAVDVYGSGLPPALSANNQYYLWGTRGYGGSVVIAINADPAKWKAWCDSVTVVARFGSSPYSMPYERNRPIVLCRQMHPPLAQMWPRFRHYGVETLGTDTVISSAK